MIYNFVQVIADERISFFYWVNDIPLCIYCIFFVCHLAAEVDVVVNAGVIQQNGFL